MRIRTFIAESMDAAIKDIRETLGPDAIIISTYESPRGRGVEVRAAVEDINLQPDIADEAPLLDFDDDLERRLRSELLGEMRSEMSTRTPKLHAVDAGPSKTEQETDYDYEVRPDGWVKTGIAGLLKSKLGAGAKQPMDESSAGPETEESNAVLSEQAWADEEIDEPLAFHNVPADLRSSLIKAAGAMGAETATLALGAALDLRMSIDPVAAIPARPIMVVGAPGSGKTVTTAKLAAQAVLAGAEVCLITTDTLRAGALAQLQSFAELLKVKLVTAETPEALARTIDKHKDQVIFIDTPATNPYIRSELNDLLKFIQATDIEPLLVAPASGDVEDFSDVTKIFASLGVRRMITTRIDAARRLGGLLVAADMANIALAQISITPYLAEGLATLNPLSLARLLIEVPSAKAKVKPTLRKSSDGMPKEAAR